MNKIVVIAFLFLSACAHTVTMRKPTPEQQAKGIIAIEEDGTYVYDTSGSKIQVTEEQKKSGVQKIESNGTYVYESSDGNESIDQQIEEKRKRDGVISIDSRGRYLYARKKEDHNRAFSLRYGVMSTPQISNVDTSAITFSSIYGSTKPWLLLLDYDFQFSKKNGIWAVQTNLDFSQSVGNGKFLNNANLKALEQYSLYQVPLSLNLSYRFQYSDNQWVVPYVSGGGGYWGMLEQRDDGRAKASGSFFAQAAGGVLLTLTAWNHEMADDLYSEHGIQNFWFVIEGRQINSLRNDLNFSSSVINGGIAFDF